MQLLKNKGLYSLSMIPTKLEFARPNNKMTNKWEQIIIYIFELTNNKNS